MVRNFSKRLCAIRKSHGLTQVEVADMLGISLRTYQSYEYAEREPGISFVAKLIQILKIDADQLFQDNI